MRLSIASAVHKLRENYMEDMIENNWNIEKKFQEKESSSNICSASFM